MEMFDLMHRVEFTMSTSNKWSCVQYKNIQPKKGHNQIKRIDFGIYKKDITFEKNDIYVIN